MAKTKTTLRENQPSVVENVRKKQCREVSIYIEYEALYDDIQNLTNKISNFTGEKLMFDEITNEQTIVLFYSLKEAASNLSGIAHELEEHLAWS